MLLLMTNKTRDVSCNRFLAWLMTIMQCLRKVQHTQILYQNSGLLPALERSRRKHFPAYTIGMALPWPYFAKTYRSVVPALMSLNTTLSPKSANTTLKGSFVVAGVQNSCSESPGRASRSTLSPLMSKCTTFAALIACHRSRSGSLCAVTTCLVIQALYSFPMHVRAAPAPFNL